MRLLHALRVHTPSSMLACRLCCVSSSLSDSLFFTHLKTSPKCKHCLWGDCPEPCPPANTCASSGSEFLYRSLQAVQQAVPGAKVSFLECDLECFASIKGFVHRLREEHEQLTVLLNNAGVFMPPGGKTKRGFEVSVHCWQASLPQGFVLLAAALHCWWGIAYSC